MSAEQLITDHLDLWTGAVTHKSGRGAGKGRELTGIKKLRELILELAVRGRLVYQAPENTSFGKLLLSLREDHTPRKTRGSKTVSGQVTSDEQPFTVPKSWTWARLGEIAENLDSQRKPITKSARKDGAYPYYGASGVVDYVDSYLFDEPLVLVGEDGAKWGKGEGTAFSISGKTWVNNHAHVLRPRKEAINDRYLVFFLAASDLNPYITGMTVPKLNQARLSSIPVAIPNLEEQHRIVAKVDELMALCDRLEQQTGDQLDAHEVLVDILLNALTHAENADEVAAQWARLAEHFDTLFITEASIDKLKQTILQLAVMGRLVEQDPKDEPASVLVDAIINERDKLKHQEGMRTKASDTIDEQEVYFSAPTHWNWIKLGNTAKFIDYRGKTPNKIKSGKRLITAKNIRQGYIDPFPEEFISEDDYLAWMTRGFPRIGDTLFTTEAPLGNAANVDIQEDFALAQRAICFQWHVESIAQFMLLQLTAPLFQKQLKENSNGMTATGIKSAKLKEIPVVLPPISEQHRIVAKVDELMGLCDQLKARLSNIGETRTHLAEAVVAQAVE